MATSGEVENDASPKVDVAGFFEAFGRTESDSGSDTEEGMSMFCKACLHPYSGEEKAGTIVLRCKNCGQTDTILEEKVCNINPQQWIGDLMKNRFLQVFVLPLNQQFIALFDCFIGLPRGCKDVNIVYTRSGMLIYRIICHCTPNTQ